MMKFNTLHDLFISELKDLYSAEKQIVRALPKMAKAASSSELQDAFQEHLQQSKNHIDRLDEIFDMLQVSSRNKKCKGIEGIIEEGQELISKGKTNSNPDALDAGIVAAAQKVEHYEIAGYGTVRTYASMLGHDKAANLLQQTLDEEKETDQKLTLLAETMINVEAAQPPNR
ncbi:MAG TPA: ferritin-like domain-containing protein [Thermodesulfobacteriota bacterium]|nr:ferritin-like domain-containing protein [Thermodesulfobacteriota bacterium]